MNDINKRLVEVECILSQLDNVYKEKIPNEIWNYINENKDKNYVFEIDNNTELEKLDLNIDTISILTYINMQYLLSDEQRKELKKLLNRDIEICERIKKNQYNPDNIFKNRIKQEDKIEENVENYVAMIKYDESFFKRIWNKILSIFMK